MPAPGQRDEVAAPPPEIEAFLDQLVYERGLSENTRESYGNDLRQFWELTRPVLVGLLRARWRDLPVFARGSLRKLHSDVEQTTRRAEPPQKKG